MSKTASRIIMATAAGVAAGLALGILFAPKKGARTRKKIKKTVNDLVEGKFPDLGEKLEDLKKAFTGGKSTEENSGTEQ
jgi:gas vesicle protein